MAVVGHTNVGKTSLLRTLTRDVGFGAISHKPSTTQHVEGARLSVDGEALIELYDTPGFEDAVALYEYIEQLPASGERLDGPEQVSRFLQTSEAAQRFEQEAKVLRQLLKSDAGFYVIDAREPVLAKYRDELAILAMCGKPLLPVLNFVNAPEQREADWREVLARLGLHAIVRFDSVAPPADGEQRLYENLSLVLDSQRSRLQRLVDYNLAQVTVRRQAGLRLIAELLVEVSATRRSVAPQQLDASIQELHDDVRKREQQCVEALLKLYAFRKEDAEAQDLPLAEGRWGEDLFNPATMKQLGVKLGGGMAAGAATGAGIDLLTGGLSLGAATMLGAAVGGFTQTFRSYGERIKGKWRGERELTVNDATLRLLAIRQQRLLHALELRGHAAQERIQMDNPQEQHWRQGELAEPLITARAYPEWSGLNGRKPKADYERSQAIARLAASLGK
ncbi:GTPase SAR1 [Oceanisphaera avium]|uniref:GTPase SAR1 n=1 Tax=Oceanisphaera avium TaxID=1903694 RepID=A0A1Y0CZR6_9GAMM|nr:GTPase SAR1 [Oceanisphaera avium]